MITLHNRNIQELHYNIHVVCPRIIPKTYFCVSVSVRSDNLQSTNDSSVGHQQQQQVDYYRERLKILRARCGLDNEVCELCIGK